jgi:serine O-acetyltransferase
MESPPLLIHRFGHALHKAGLRGCGSLVTWLNRFLFACYLPSSATVGRNVKLGYWGLGIVIHSDSVIGDDCWIMQNVTLGRNIGDPGVPKLGRNVAVGAGAVIMGGVELGDHCIVGANSVVRQSFPPRSVVAGVPARLLRTTPENEVRPHYENR